MTWRTVKLGDVCSINNGGTPKSKVREYWDGGVQWLTPKDMGKLTSRYVFMTERQISQEGLDNSSAKIIPQESVILSCRAPIGHVAINQVPMSFNQGCKGLVPSDEIIVEYLYYFLISSKQLLNDLGTGATFKEISAKTLHLVDVPLPPIAEQQRIVAKLDAAFAEIDTKVEAALSIIKNIISFKASLLDVALSGIDKSKHSYTLQNLLDIGWIESHLDGNHGSDYPRKSEFTDAGVPYISANCICNGNLEFKKAKYLSVDRAAKLRKGIAKNGDVLFAHNATVGPTAILQTNEEKVILGTSLTYFRCNDQMINNEYLLAFMRSRNFINQYTYVMSQATRNQVPITKQRTFTFLVPDMSVQQNVAETVKKLTELTAEIIDKTGASMNQLQALKSAILSQELQSGEAA